MLLKEGRLVSETSVPSRCQLVSAQRMNDTSAIICHAHLLAAANATGAAVAHGPSV